MSSAIISLKQLFPEQLHERIFLVGGSVRDHQLGRQGKDIDLAAAISDREFSEFGFRLVTGKSTAPIWFRYDSVIGTIEAVQLENVAALRDDLLRRDFSINAMAMALSGEIIDPLGGNIDLADGILRACSGDTFKNDPLRIFRAFRFETDGWRMAADTEALICVNDGNWLLTGIPVERFSREMIKALGSRIPELFFQRMLEFGAGKAFLPELFLMLEIPAGPLLFHPEGDLLTHSIEVLQRASLQSSDPLTRFCAFFHDIGKLATNPSHYPKHHGHDQAGFKLASFFCNRLKLPAAYRTALAWVSRLHSTINLWNELRDSTKLRMAEQAIKAGISTVLPIVSNADKSGAFKTEEWEKVLGIAGMTITELGIADNQLAEVKESKRKDYILQKRIEIFRKNK